MENLQSGCLFPNLGSFNHTLSFMQLNVLTEMVTKLKDFAGFSLGVPMFLPTRVHDTSLTLCIGAEI